MPSLTDDEAFAAMHRAYTEPQIMRFDLVRGWWARHYALALWLVLTGEHKGELYVPRER